MLAINVTRKSLSGLVTFPFTLDITDSHDELHVTTASFGEEPKVTFERTLSYFSPFANLMSILSIASLTISSSFILSLVTCLNTGKLPDFSSHILSKSHDKVSKYALSLNNATS